MLIGIALLMILVLVFLNLVLGQSFVASFVNVGIDSDAIVDGVSSTFVVNPENVLFQIDTSSLIIAGISILTTVIIIASITGISVFGTGLSTESTRIIILLTAYIGLWSSLTVLAFNLIMTIPVFASMIYIGLTIMYSVGVIQKISS